MVNAPKSSSIPNQVTTVHVKKIMEDLEASLNGGSIQVNRFQKGSGGKNPQGSNKGKGIRVIKNSPKKKKTFSESSKATIFASSSHSSEAVPSLLQSQKYLGSVHMDIVKLDVASRDLELDNNNNVHLSIVQGEDVNLDCANRDLRIDKVANAPGNLPLSSDNNGLDQVAVEKKGYPP